MSKVVNLKGLMQTEGGLSRSLSLAEDAAQTLRSMILLEKLPPGISLPERELSEALGISRTPLREAIRLLANEGLVQFTAARRPFVANPTLDEINNCLRVQGALEAVAGELACVRASDGELQEIAKINQAIAEINTDDGDGKLAGFQADMRFHEAIVRAAGNPPLAETHAAYNARLWRVRFLSSQRRAGRISTRQEHSDIVAALLARDARAAARALKAHLKTAETNIAQALSERESARISEEQA
uniref:GntR family transcriptional regulator n=1 Tax=Pararhizobium sp. IMCC3301 TaxID=3067904 RepID=UPI0027417194|nr:GntR family transcriptional regulator [Pararhizobium sp. IMCC3301]